MTELELRQSCHTLFAGNRQPSPAEQFAAMAQWCEANDVRYDSYGDGAQVQAFERRVAAMLGFEAGLFCATGTLAQSTALRLACMERGSPLVALHPSAHIIVHESSNYQLLSQFQVLQVGDPFRPWTLETLRALPDRLGAVLLELPMREIGGQLTDWEELAAIKAWCAERRVHLHMDGARLWESAAGYGKTYAGIAAGFDSVYVSLYKGLGGIGGALLLGKRDFLARARQWNLRQGGKLTNFTPYAVSAGMQFDQRLAAMPDCFRRTEWLYGVLRGFPMLTPNPERPHCNMLHVHLPVTRERANAVRDRIAREHGVWLFGGVRNAALPGRSYFEWYVGDNLLAMDDARVLQLLALLADGLAQPD